MTSRVITGSSVEPRAARYQKAERALWDHYGLQPIERFIQLDSPAVRLRVLEVGSGEPMLLVHGTVGSGSWPSLIKELPGYRCIVVDRPGWGPSEPVDFSKLDYRRVVADILRGVLDVLDIEHTAVVGGSIGDVWALSLAEHYPSRVDRIILLGGGPMVPDIRPPQFIRTLASPIGAIIVRLPVKPDRVRSILRDSGHGASLDTGGIPAPFIDWRVALSNDTASMRHERDMVRSVLGSSGWKPGFMFEDRQLAQIKHRTLLIYGTADPTGSVELWRRFTDALPHGELRVVDGAGHMPWFDDARQVAGDIQRFLAPATG